MKKEVRRNMKLFISQTPSPVRENGIPDLVRNFKDKVNELAKDQLVDEKQKLAAEEREKQKKIDIQNKLQHIFEKKKDPSAAYHMLMSKKCQNNYYQGLINDQTSKIADQIMEQEKKDDERDTAMMYILEDYQREKFMRRKLHRQMVNSRIKNLAEIKMFKRNYKNLAMKIGAAAAVCKNRERIKHDIPGG